MCIVYERGSKDQVRMEQMPERSIKGGRPVISYQIT